MLWRRWRLTAVLVIALLIFNCDGYGKVCQCINHSGTKGNEWGILKITSNDNRMNGTDCTIVYVRAAPGEIVELRFYDIHLRTGCQDDIQLFPNLKESTVSEAAIDDAEVICQENAFAYVLKPLESDDLRYHGGDYSENSVASMKPLINHTEMSGGRFRIEHKRAVYSSSNVLGIRLNYKTVESLANNYFYVRGFFRFLSKSLFKIDGNLLPTTLCDYQFLPHPINYARENKYENALWRYFYSPRYPAKYSGHVKCAYKFIGRPNTLIEVLFEEIYLPPATISVNDAAAATNDSKSCINLSDKITVYDGKTASDKTSIVDVYCNEKLNKKIISSGPNLLIEFESSSNRTSNGFSAKYRFTETQDLLSSSSTIPSGGGGGVELKFKASTKSLMTQSTTMSTLMTSSADNSIVYTSSSSSIRRKGTTCPPATNCDFILLSSTSINGTINSPMYPGPYAPRSFCRFEFKGHGKQRIQIKFTEFTLPSEGDGDDCDQADTVQVLMPSKGKYEPVETLCGETLPKPIMSNGPQMLLEFRGRQSGQGNRGFKAEYVFLENFGIMSGRQMPDRECSFAFNSSTASSGHFHSPNFPGAYPRNIECSYFFHGRSMEKVDIRFTYFDVEGIYPCDADSSSDTVEFSNFNSMDRKFTLHCEKKPMFSVKSDGKFFRITFRSNDRLDGTGFRASYKFEKEEATTETMQLANINNNYINNAMHNRLGNQVWLAFVCCVLIIVRSHRWKVFL